MHPNSSREIFYDQNQYQRGICLSLLDAEQAHVLKKYPRLLILTLDRVSYSAEAQTRIKIMQNVEIPYILSARSLRSIPVKLDSGMLNAENKPYHLTSMTIHSGDSPDSGHYYCVCYEDGFFPEYSWYLFDDVSVTSFNAADLNKYLAERPNDTPYVCIYQESLTDSSADRMKNS